MSRQSGFPYRVAGDLPQELIDYLEGIAQPVSAVADISASPTNEEIATKINALLAALRAAGKMGA